MDGCLHGRGSVLTHNACRWLGVDHVFLAENVEKGQALSQEFEVGLKVRFLARVSSMFTPHVPYRNSATALHRDCSVRLLQHANV